MVPHIAVHSAALYSQIFPSCTGHFETAAPNDRKMILNTKGSRVPNIHVITSRVPTFTPVHSTAGHSRVTGYFEKSAPNDSKMAFFKLGLFFFRQALKHV